MDTTFTPNIIRESSTGYFSSRIQDELFSERKIYCLGVINSSTANELVIQLEYLSRISDDEITMYINSPGGEVSSGLAIYDMMKSIRCPVRTVCIGTAASMGAVLFSSGDIRELYTHSRVMIHDPLIGNLQGSALKVKEYTDQLLKSRELIAEILSENTGKSVKEILEKTAADTYFDAQEAIEFGLADKIIGKS